MKLPHAISAIDMCEYLTEIEDGKAEARLALFVLTEGHHLYRFSVVHPGLYGGLWPPAPEPECFYTFTKVGCLFHQRIAAHLFPFRFHRRRPRSH